MTHVTPPLSVDVTRAAPDPSQPIHGILEWHERYPRQRFEPASPVGPVVVPGMRRDSRRLKRFLDEYESHVRDVLQPTQDEIRRILTEWQRPEHWVKYKRTNRIPIPTPLKVVYSRIKRPEQVVDKIFRKPERYPAGLQAASFRAMHDTIGVRIVVFFLSHLPLVDRELRSSSLFEVSSAEPSTAYMSSYQAKVLSLDHLVQEEKESGYSSVHYVLRLREPASTATDRPWFEVQVQTAAQELWSEMEHHLGYKPGRRSNMTSRRQLKILATMMSAIDEHFDLLYDELNRYQEAETYGDADVLMPENLAAVLAEHGVSCAQRDVNNILKFLDSRGVSRVRDVRALATPKRLTIIRSTYLAVSGRLPANLEVIATLAALRGASSESAEIERIKAQISYRGAWDSIRQEFHT